jgi:hypothetical protein
MRRIIFPLVVVAAVSAGLAIAALAQSPAAPVLNQCTAEDRTVSGRAEPGSGPLRIYDVANGTRTLIGDQTTMDGDGNFAVPVSPPLVRGHQVVAVDKHDRASAPTTVKPPDPATGPPSQSNP